MSRAATLAGSVGPGVEQNLTLAVVVFMIGLLATVVTAVVVAHGHRRWRDVDPTADDPGTGLAAAGAPTVAERTAGDRS